MSTEVSTNRAGRQARIVAILSSRLTLGEDFKTSEIAGMRGRLAALPPHDEADPSPTGNRGP